MRNMDWLSYHRLGIYRNENLGTNVTSGLALENHPMPQKSIQWSCLRIHPVAMPQKANQ